MPEEERGKKRSTFQADHDECTHREGMLAEGESSRGGKWPVCQRPQNTEAWASEGPKGRLEARLERSFV